MTKTGTYSKIPWVLCKLDEFFFETERNFHSKKALMFQVPSGAVSFWRESIMGVLVGRLAGWKVEGKPIGSGQIIATDFPPKWW